MHRFTAVLLHSRVLVAVCMLVISPFLCNRAFAQTSGTGSINGTVTDPSGSVVPNATIKATNNATGVQTSTSSTSSGYFGFRCCSRERIRSMSRHPGFSTLSQQNVVVDALANVAFSPKLAVGTMNQTVTVSEQRQC